MIPVQVVGLGMSPADLTSKTLEIIHETQVLGAEQVVIHPNLTAVPLQALNPVWIITGVRGTEKGESYD